MERKWKVKIGVKDVVKVVLKVNKLKNKSCCSRGEK